MSHYYDNSLYDMNVYNCMSGQAVLSDSRADSRTTVQECCTCCRGNCKFTRCVTREIPETLDTSLPTPTCVAVNQLDFGENSNCCRECCCKRKCCHKCCPKKKCCRDCCCIKHNSHNCCC